MLGNIRTSLQNKEIISDLTYKLQLGPENIIARMAFSYSIANSPKLNLRDIKDSKGKEYNPKILFGTNNIPVYVAMICQKYGIYKTDKDIQKFVKMHVDDGLEVLNREYRKNPNMNSFDFFLDKIEKGLNLITA